MRITKLTLAGFGPYKNQQVVDFARFDEAGLFLITGKTGAGKSSILDAICFALYGSVPRYDGTQAQLRSDHCEVDDPTYVELEFTVGGVAYSVHRTPEYLRAKKSGTGTTKQAHDASLSRAGEVIAAKPVDVAHELADIVALTKDQFLQVVLLAQNRFQQFLLARNDDRQAVLRTLFGSQRFLSLETALDDRRKLLQTELAEADAVLRQHAVEAARLLELDEVPAVTDAAWFESGYASLAGERSFAKVISGSADVAFTAADIDYQGVLAVVALQERRGVALETIADLEGSAVTVAGHRAVVAAARRAAPVWPLIGELDKATAALESAAARHEAARAAFGSDADPLAEVDALTATIGALADVLADEKQLPSVAADIDRLAVALDLDETALAASVERRDALPAEIDAVGVQITETAVRAARVTEATEQVARIREARDSEQSALDLDVRLELARVAEKETSAAHTAAGAALDALYERRLGGFAAELATTLTPGEPCAVCGSLEHPAPASHDGTPVTADDIEAARQTVAERRSAMDVAHDLAGTIAASLAEARGRTQGKTLDDLDAELRTAQESLTAATDAARELAEREADRDRLRAELASADDRVAALRSGRDATVKLLTEATSRRDGISARVDASRGDAESVTARVRQLSDRLTVARAAVDAAATAVTRAEAQARAEAALVAQLRENDFADVEEARSARRPASEIATLEAEIRRHDEARA
ncbi:AAA family ATPase, partial [Conyzicola lurida]